MKNILFELILVVMLLVTLAIVYLLFGDKLREKLGLHKKNYEDPIEGTITDYNIYKMTINDLLTYVLGGSIAFILLSIIFYKSLFIGLVSALGYIFIVLKWPHIITNNLKKKRREVLAKQFKDALHSISSEITSGRSFSNILQEGSIISSLDIIYDKSKKNRYIVYEFTHIAKEMRNNVTEEQLLRDFAQRSGLEDVRNFVDVLIICRKQGGDLNEIVKKTSRVIIEKMEIEEDIKTIISQKQGEQKIMTILPLGMIMILSFTAPDYMAPLYETIFPGRLVMTLALGLIILAHFISKKIMDIEV